MPSAFTHAVAGASIALAFRAPRGACALAAGLAVLPDADILGFSFGVAYGHPFGHRGFTHSLAFAALCGALAFLPAVRRLAPGLGAPALAAALLLATASHGVLDAMTNGAMGVGFFLPFEESRYFFPFRPIEVSPIGPRFFTARGVEILRNELLWVWLPCLALVLAARWRPWRA